MRRGRAPCVEPGWVQARASASGLLGALLPMLQRGEVEGDVCALQDKEMGQENNCSPLSSAPTIRLPQGMAEVANVPWVNFTEGCKEHQGLECAMLARPQPSLLARAPRRCFHVRFEERGWVIGDGLPSLESPSGHLPSRPARSTCAARSPAQSPRRC